MGPGAIWFYYGIESSNCDSPIDRDMALLVICYFVIGILLLIPVLSTCLNKYYCFIFLKIINVLYLAGKLTVLIIMIANVQSDYYRNWEDNICDNLKPLTTFWLIWNYIMMSFTFIYSICYIASSTCDSYDDYDFDPST